MAVVEDEDGKAEKNLYVRVMARKERKKEQASTKMEQEFRRHLKLTLA